MSSKRSVNKKTRIHKRSTGPVRAQIIFSGLVQYTNFRGKAQDKAYELGLKGQVENLEDGRVKVLCEGSRAKIKEFIKVMKLEDNLAKVKGVEISYSKAKGQFKTFTVKVGTVYEELMQGVVMLERLYISMEQPETISNEKRSSTGRTTSNYKEPKQIMNKR